MGLLLLNIDCVVDAPGADPDVLPNMEDDWLSKSDVEDVLSSANAAYLSPPLLPIERPF